MDLCNSLESSGLSESSGINLHNQKMCTSCDENLVGTLKMETNKNSYSKPFIVV